VEAIQHLYDIYRSAVQIQEILTRIDDAKNFEKVAAEMLPDYDIDELITTLQNTDIDIAHIQKIQSAMNKIRELYHMDTTYIDVKAALYNASKDIIREYFFILEKWAQTSQEVQLIDLWYYIDNSIGLIAGSRDKDIIQERKEVVSQSIGRERIMDAIRELYTTCIDNTLERKETAKIIFDYILSFAKKHNFYPIIVSTGGLVPLKGYIVLPELKGNLQSSA